MTNEDIQFVEGLKAGNLDQLKSVPKAEKHCHMDLGGNLDNFRKLTGKEIKSLPVTYRSFDDFQNYILDELDPIFSTIEGDQLAKLNTIQQTKEDSVLLLEASMDDGFSYHYGKDYQKLIDYLEEAINKLNPDLDFRPELGLGRTDNIQDLERIAFFNIETGYFKSIDLYGDEMNDDPVKYQNIFRRAKAQGLKLKAHIGEFANAEAIKKTIDVLELDEIQHGINAYQSISLMEYLAQQNITLNICPTSNLLLHAVETIEEHPIRKLFDHQVKVTINTDDYLIFNKSLSEEFLMLYQAGVFTAEELNLIRKNGLA